MTNIRTTLGAGLWVAISSLLMLATLEPISIEPAATDIAAVATAPARG